MSSTARTERAQRHDPLVRRGVGRGERRYGARLPRRVPSFDPGGNIFTSCRNGSSIRWPIPSLLLRVPAIDASALITLPCGGPVAFRPEARGSATTKPRGREGKERESGQGSQARRESRKKELTSTVIDLDGIADRVVASRCPKVDTRKLAGSTEGLFTSGRSKARWRRHLRADDKPKGRSMSTTSRS